MNERTMLELPRSYEAEASVLGSILLQPELIHKCYLQPDDFFSEQNELILKFMYYLRDKAKPEPVDIVLIGKAAGKDVHKIGGVSHLFELRDSVPDPQNFERYQRIVRETSLTRKGMLLMERKAREGEGASNPEEYLDSTIHALEDLRNSTDKGNGFTRLGDVLVNHEVALKERKEQNGLTGTKSASADLDKLTGGDQKQDFTVIPARPSIGKTDFMVDSVIKGQRNAIEAKIEGSAAVIFSLEMKESLIAERAICNIGNVDNKKLKSGEMDADDWHRWKIASDYLKELPIFIDDYPSATVQQIDRKVGELVKIFPNLTVYIDFLQKVKPGIRFVKKDEGIAFVSESLKEIARKHNCPVNALSAVGRECEKRNDKRPTMSDIRGSSSIESDADNIIFLYRDEYYNRETTKKGIMEIIVAKGRNVGVGVVEMVYLPQFSKFVDIERKLKDGATHGEQNQN